MGFVPARKNGPNVGPITGPKCYLNRMHASTSNFGWFGLLFGPFLLLFDLIGVFADSDKTEYSAFLQAFF